MFIYICPAHPAHSVYLYKKNKIIPKNLKGSGQAACTKTAYPPAHPAHTPKTPHFCNYSQYRHKPRPRRQKPPRATILRSATPPRPRRQKAPPTHPAPTAQAHSAMQPHGRPAAALWQQGVPMTMHTTRAIAPDLFPPRRAFCRSHGLIPISNRKFSLFSLRFLTFNFLSQDFHKRKRHF